MQSNGKLSGDDFEQVVRNTPLVSIDIVCRDASHRVLVMRRRREPAKGFYFVPGGRVLKNERMSDAFRRILRDEIGRAAKFEEARLMGAYEHIYSTNRFDKAGFGTHYVVLAYEVGLPGAPSITLDDDHDAYKWVEPGKPGEIEDVHDNVKPYLRADTPAS
jgi:GDP-mannose mannosyl hydrolase